MHAAIPLEHSNTSIRRGPSHRPAPQRAAITGVGAASLTGQHFGSKKEFDNGGSRPQRLGALEAPIVNELEHKRAAARMRKPRKRAARRAEPRGAAAAAAPASGLRGRSGGCDGVVPRRRGRRPTTWPSRVSRSEAALAAREAALEQREEQQDEEEEPRPKPVEKRRPVADRRALIAKAVKRAQQGIDGRLPYFLHLHKAGGTTVCHVARMSNELNAAKRNCNAPGDGLRTIEQRTVRLRQQEIRRPLQAAAAGGPEAPGRLPGRGAVALTPGPCVVSYVLLFCDRTTEPVQRIVAPLSVRAHLRARGPVLDAGCRPSRRARPGRRFKEARRS